MHCSVVVLKYVSANPLKMALKKLEYVNKLCQKWISSQVVSKDFKAIYGIFHVLLHGIYTFSLFVFALVKCISCFSFLCIWNRTNNKNSFFKHYICLYNFNYLESFLFFLEHLTNKFETTLGCTLTVAWNWRSQTGSRTPATSKMEFFVTIVNSFQPLK